MIDRIHSCIDSLYAAGLNPHIWPEAMSAVANLFGAGHATIGAAGRANRPDFTSSSVNDDRVDVYRDHWWVHDRLCDLEAAAPTPVFVETDVVSGNDLVKPFYRNYLETYGIGLRYGMTIEPTPGHVVTLIIYPARHAPTPNADTLEVLTVLRGHLERAAMLSKGGNGSGQNAGSLETVLGRLNFGSALVDGLGGIIYANEKLMTLGGDGLGITGRQLTAEHPDDQPALDRLIGRALNIGRGAEGRSPAMLRRSSGRRPLLLHALPLPTNLEAGPIWRPADQQGALVVVVDPEESRQTDSEAALRLLGLTRMEARVASLIGEAESPDDIGRTCGIEPSTVRVHLKRTYAKLAVSGQVELAVLSSRLGIPFTDLPGEPAGPLPTPKRTRTVRSVANG